MWREISEELRHLQTTPRALRRFGLVVGGVFAGIAAVIFVLAGIALTTWVWILGLPGLLLILFALVHPAALKPVQWAWMGLAFVLGFVMTRVILTLVFVTLVIPIGLVLRLVGKELLARGSDAGLASYWERRSTSEPLRERMARLY